MSTDDFSKPIDDETERQTGTCRCGQEVVREVPTGDGWIAKMSRNAPFICDPCAERETREREEAERKEAQAKRDAARRRDIADKLRRSELPSMLARHTFEGLASTADPSALTAARQWVDAFDAYRPKTDRELREDAHTRAYGDPDHGLFADDGTPLAAVPPGWGGPDTDRRGLLLSGTVGVGKTTIAAAAVRELCGRHIDVRWLSVPILFVHLGHGFGDEHRDRALRRLIDTVPLVLDDLDKTRPSAFAADALFTAIDSRLAAGVPIAATTNLDLSELAGKWPHPWGETIASRLLGYCEVVTMVGEDRRAA